MSFIADSSTLVIERDDRKKHDLGLILSALALMCVGLFSIHSVDVGQGTAHMYRQMVFAAIGIVVFYIFNKFKLEYFKVIATPLYILNLVMLVATLFLGKSRGITSRWIEIGPMQFQPSEVSKLLLAITLATYFANRQDRIRELPTFLGALAHAIPIVALVLLQPHLGASVALLFLAIIAAINVGTPWKYFPVVFGVIFALVAAAWVTPNVVPGYMRDRVDAKIQEFVYGNRDIRGDGYQQDQAMLAIGSGGATGAGFYQGNQKAAGVIPEQHTDFIFSVIGEEGGFFGSVLVICMFGVFFFFVWRRVYMAKSVMGQVVASSLFAVLAFHTIVNLAMVLRFGPVVGLWLPFMSYGGTALWMCMGAVGLLDQCE